MAREEKPVKLRMVDDDTEPPVPIIRLDNLETGQIHHEKPIRLGPSPEESLPGVRHRLDLPTRDDVEVRTHQPGIDVLLEPEFVAPESAEAAWGTASSRGNPIPWGWFILVALLVCGAVVWSWARVHKADARADQLESHTQSILKSEEQEQKEAAQLIDRIDKTIRDYFNATAVEPLLRLVRQPERVKPLMHRYYSNRPVFTASFRAYSSLETLTLDNHGNFWIATVSLSDGIDKKLIIEIDPSGTPKIDWETLVCYQPMPWDDYARQRPAGVSMDFRVYAVRDSFYSHEFANSERWNSYHLTAYNSEEVLFGYVPKGGDLDNEISKLMEKEKTNKVSLILRLNVPQGIQSHRGVIIEKVVNNRWLIINAAGAGS